MDRSSALQMGGANPASRCPRWTSTVTRGVGRATQRSPCSLTQVSLARKVQVTRLGSTSEEAGTEATVIVRERAMGAGVVVDPAGYIMTPTSWTLNYA